MWGFEMFGKRAEKQRGADGKELGGAPRVTVDQAAREADAAIAKAKRTGDVHISDPYNPNQYGADKPVGPRTEVRQSTPVAEDGAEGLRINPNLLEEALENPVELGGPAVSKPTTVNQADSLRSAVRANDFSLDPKQVEAALVSGKLPDAIAIKKAPWQPDMFVEPKSKPLSPTPMGTPDDLRTRGKLQGVEDDWTAAKRAARVDNPEGLKSLRTPGGVVGVEDKWKAAKRAVEGSRSEEGLAAFRTKPGSKQQNVEAAPGKEAQREELRARCWDKIQELRQMIVLAADPSEKELMEDVLERSLKNYKRDFGDFPAEV